MDMFSIIVRMSMADSHYGGGVVAGARILELFGDAVTGLTAAKDGDEGLLSSWDSVRFLKPVHSGDFIRVEARIVKSTSLRRLVEVTAHRFIRGGGETASTAAPVEPAECVAEAEGVVVIPWSVARKRSQQ